MDHTEIGCEGVDGQTFMNTVMKLHSPHNYPCAWASIHEVVCFVESWVRAPFIPNLDSFTPTKTVSSTHWIRDHIKPTVGLDVVI